MVVSQLTARSLSIAEDPGSNPTIGNFYWTIFLLNVYRKDENKEKEAENGPFEKVILKAFDRWLRLCFKVILGLEQKNGFYWRRLLSAFVASCKRARVPLSLRQRGLQRPPVHSWHPRRASWTGIRTPSRSRECRCRHSEQLLQMKVKSTFSYSSIRSIYSKKFLKIFIIFLHWKLSLLRHHVCTYHWHVDRYLSYEM